MTVISTAISNYDAGAFENILVSQSGSVAGLINLAGRQSQGKWGGHSELVVAGSVSSQFFLGGGIEDRGIDAQSDRIWVTTSGFVNEIFLGGDGHKITNAGSVGYVTFINIFGLFAAGSRNEISNSGQLGIVDFGSSIRSFGSTDTIINNSGTIFGRLPAPLILDVGIFLESGADTIRNSGSIIGLVHLGDGNNQLTNSGSVDGLITAGFDNDTINNSGTISGNVDLGDGTNIFNSSAGSLFGEINGGNDFNEIRTSNIGNTVHVGSGVNFVYGGLGADQVFGTGQNFFYGGAGNDSLNSTGNLGDNLNGDEGDDFLSGGGGADTLHGGTGNDRLDGGVGADVMIGGAGDDLYTVDNVGDVVNELMDGGSGIDAVFTKTIDINLSDKLHFSGQIENINTSPFFAPTDLKLTGNASDNIITGNSGNNILTGLDGNDTLRGGFGSDRLSGNTGEDELYGERGSDVIYSGAGADVMDGGDDVDTAYYSTETVGAIINLLNQTLNAGSALGDTLLNFELIFGSNIAADNITGGNGNETILGNGGNDILNGSGGGDTMRGGAGADTLNGGTGADKFQYTALNEVGDFIITYEASDDFQFTRAAFGNLAGTNVAAVNFLSVATGHAATTANHRFIFDQALDQLWYDADGSSAGVAVMVADLSNNINITNLDLLLL
jgi:Ca2+-binding RTX toxin-like protein